MTTQRKAKDLVTVNGVPAAALMLSGNPMWKE